jgi:hypothetical protein
MTSIWYLYKVPFDGRGDFLMIKSIIYKKRRCNNIIEKYNLKIYMQ